MQAFTKEQYLQWVASRGSVESWTLEDCLKADLCIKQHALQNAEKHLREYKLPPALQEYIMTTLRVHFGSVDVDELLAKLKLYPEWID